MAHNQKIALKLADHIEMHLDQLLEVTQLAEQYRLSKSTLERIFKEVFHQTIHQYIRKKRLEKAFRLINLTDAPIKLIAYQVGFKSVTSFTRAFRCYFDATPASLRKNRPPLDKMLLLNKKSPF